MFGRQKPSISRKLPPAVAPTTPASPVVPPRTNDPPLTAVAPLENVALDTLNAATTLTGVRRANTASTANARGSRPLSKGHDQMLMDSPLLCPPEPHSLR